MPPPPMPEAAKRLLLFDIDGTLITSGGAGERALREAMRERFAVEEDLRGMVIAGATDAAIARELLARHKIDPSPGNLSALLDSYLHSLHHLLPKHQGYLLPGIVNLLDELHKRSHCVLGLLTGNLHRGAQIKLAHYGVWDYFEFGAFADDHPDRNELGRFARARAEESHGIEFPPDQIYIIGDTPRDIACARAIGAHSVAIATGNYSLPELEAHQPDHLFTDLSNTNQVLSVLAGQC